ncbi:uncharacterized protein LOC108101924 [Drosophila ficusphila]|uniref:uncharacterized protein LOC108101924 n=1 Tax=Drosophila ficusphila TaxID=30025 RepID=UPI0007E7C3A7|nr:uncharacterized protein LOC108101924 [Drosophila ficusphila]
MPGQYTNYRFTRGTMVILRCLWAILYLWGMLHAAAIIPIPNERWESKLWTKKLRYELKYHTLFDLDGKTEVYVLVLVVVLLYGLYHSCRCSFVGARYLEGRVDKPHLDYRLLVFKVPYLVAFVFSWVFSTGLTVCGALLVALRDQSGHTHVLCCQFAMAILFKLLVLANFYSVCVRTWAYLKMFEAETDEHMLNYQNFGDHLNLFFRV